MGGAASAAWRWAWQRVLAWAHAKPAHTRGPHAANVTVLHNDSCLWLQVEEHRRRGIRCMAVGLADCNGPWRMPRMLTLLHVPACMNDHSLASTAD